MRKTQVSFSVRPPSYKIISDNHTYLFYRLENKGY